MRNPVLEQTYHTVVPVTDAAGFLVDADALPTGTVYLDGAPNGTVVTVADIGVGLYHISFAMTAAEGFADGDAISLLFFAIIVEVDAAATALADLSVCVFGRWVR